MLRGFVKNRNALLQSYVQAALYHNAGGVLLWQVVPSGLGFRSGPYDISYTVSDGGPALNQLIKWKDQMVCVVADTQWVACCRCAWGSHALCTCMPAHRMLDSVPTSTFTREAHAPTSNRPIKAARHAALWYAHAVVYKHVYTSIVVLYKHMLYLSHADAQRQVLLHMVGGILHVHVWHLQIL